jgi:hypothetical protein
MTSRTARLPPWVFPAALVLLAFCFRILIGHFYSFFSGDTPGYTAIAKNLAAFHGYSLSPHAPYAATDIRLPGYPFLLALAFAVSDSHWSAIILNSLLGAVSTLLVWLISTGLHLTRTRALWATGIAAVFLSTASFAGDAQSENLSVPAVLALVYFVLIRPPKSRWALFIGGSALAWLVALTRDELVVFVILVAIVAARRANLRALGTLALVVCFLLGSGAWVLRNTAQVHRVEYVDTVMTEQVLVASVNGNLGAKGSLYKKASSLIRQPVVSQAERANFQHLAFAYVRNTLSHHFPTYVENKVKFYTESLFPVPIYGLTYTSPLKEVGRFLWSVLLAIAYVIAFLTSRRWWKSGRRPEVVSIWLFPVFILCFQIVFDPQYRFLLPATLLLLPFVIEGVAYAAAKERATRRQQGATPVNSPP